MLTRDNLNSAKKIVIKVGTSTLTNSLGKLNHEKIRSLAKELTDLRKEGKKIVLVTSAAISAGMERLGLTERPTTIPEKQAVAAVGQGILMQIYEKMFAECGQIVAQILMTREDSVKRNRYTNIRNTFNTLLNKGIIPVVNENDAVSIDELKIGDNDTLSAQVASIVDADLVIILTDIEGLYTANPKEDPKAKLVHEITAIDEKVELAAGGAGSKYGTGGMFTKIQAAKIAVSSGIAMVVVGGEQDGVIKQVLSGEKLGTLFLSRKNRLQLRKRWLAFGARVKGKLVVDKGCANALLKGSSLLPAGIVNSEGDYCAGDTLGLYCENGQEIARGLTNYAYIEVEQLKGAKTSDIMEILGYKSYDEVIHRDNLVIITGDK